MKAHSKKSIFVLLVLCSKFNTSKAKLHPLVLDVMANLEDRKLVAVGAFGNASNLIIPRISNLPKPIWLWTRFHQGSFDLLKFVLMEELRLSEVVIFLPWVASVPKEFPGIVDIAGTVAFKTQWVVSTDDTESFDWISKLRHGACQVVAVFPTHIEEPENGFANCALRRNISNASQVFRHREADARKYPRNLKLTIVSLNDDATAVPEVAALIEAYETLNTSLIQLDPLIGVPGYLLVHTRSADIDVHPKILIHEFAQNYYFYAMYPPCHICFFTRVVAGKGSSLPQDGVTLVIFICSFLILALSIVFVSCHLPSSANPTKYSVMIMYLVSTFLGRSPQNPRMAGYTLKTLLSLWMLGTFIVGSYLQSHITADIYAPSLKREVEDLQELAELIDAGRILPCMDYSFLLTAFYSYLQNPFMKKMMFLSYRNSKNCVSYDRQSRCYWQAHQGRHVYVRPCCSFDEYISFQQGLLKGRGTLQIYHRVVTMLPHLPERRQHRRLLLAIAESGMDFQQQKKVGAVPSAEGEIFIPHPFFDYMCVFASGCVCAILVFCLEVVNFRVCLKRGMV
ncbi:hypothetical protein HPB48_005661 [Haemaphysalis longicornis]|uniref:Ionotropic receptor n=1 Tax=Haemaphysalis longicornis TaxID=44386 RepID=A0A9J6GPL6_HAELO|nr:hypothetical protein HPB48_005661 [Haemaphysalis longicornis]